MNTKLLLLIAATVAATGLFLTMDQELDTTMINQWANYKATHNKVYDAEEEIYRFAVYCQNIKEINEHNAGKSTYTKAENLFADLTKEEFKGIYLGWKQSSQPSKAGKVHTEGIYGDSVDWSTNTDVVNPVKNQGQCGSCWAFSTVGSTEPAIAIATGNHVESYSEQEQVDCNKNCYGCSGGLMDYGFQYFIANFICTEESYPYKAVAGSCEASSCTKAADNISDYTDVQSSDSALKSAVTQQPVSIAVDAEQWSFYSGGVFSDCGSQLDHGVVLVGYDADASWKVRNSWGPTWGESGYIRLAMGNTCGLENSASYPTK